MHYSVGRTTRVPRVLIADSDPQLRQLLYGALLAADVFSDCVSTVPDALARLSEEPYAVVLVDVELPGGNADQIVSAIARSGQPERPVVLVIASNPAHARSLDIDVVQIVLRKPLALRQTVDLIRSCVQSAATTVAEEPEADGDHATS